MKRDTDERIMVVKRELLLGRGHFQGFRTAGEHDYETPVLQHHTFMPRTSAERDPSYKQPIAYCIIINPRIQRFLVYRRSSREGDYSEARLRGKWSIGIGGHIDHFDTGGNNPLIESMRRELNEEIHWDEPFTPALLGYLNDEEDSVGGVHFGLLYLLTTLKERIELKAKEIAEARLVSINEWHSLRRNPDYHIENWSCIASEPLLHVLPKLT